MEFGMSLVFTPKIAYGFRKAELTTDNLGSTSPAQVLELIKLRMDSVTFHEIAQKLGKSRSHWCYEAKRLGIAAIVSSKKNELVSGFSNVNKDGSA